VLAINTPKHYFDIRNIPGHINSKITLQAHYVDTRIRPHALISNLLFSRLPYNATRFFSDDFAGRLRSLLAENDFDVIQLEGLYMAYYIPLIRKHSKARIALRAHNIEHEIWQRTANLERSKLKRFYFRSLAKRIRAFKQGILNSYDLLIPITERDANRYNQMGNSRPYHVSPVGYQLADSQPEPGKIIFPSLGCIGTLDWFPNQEGVVWFLDNVWPGIRKNHPNLTLRIAGRNAPPWLEKQFNRPGVSYLGEIDDAKKFIQQTAIMVVPLFSGSGMRVKIIEGMALGKTIITTSIGAEGIPVTHMENIVVEDTAEGFSNSIDRLLKDPALFDSIGKNASLFIHNRFDNKKICKALSDFYKENPGK